MNTWISSDYHIGEQRMDLMMRPFKNSKDMLNWMVYKHNCLVSQEDIVYVNGDVCFQKTPEELPNIDLFNGRKILIRGNHDRVFSDSELLKYFEQVIPEGDGIKIDIEDIPLYITHYPNQSLEDRFNLVGHIHSLWKVQLNMINVGVDANHFTPLCLEKDIPFLIKAIKEFYDDDVWASYMPVNQKFLGIRGKKGSYFNKE